jgi:nicotinate-nucleotide--dimethylbenzimidazole phosphoribosyltransferase
MKAIKFSAVCAAQNIWLSLTEQGFSMGWISILNYYQFNWDYQNILNLWAIFVGKPATSMTTNHPMLQQLNWKQKIRCA